MKTAAEPFKPEQTVICDSGHRIQARSSNQPSLLHKVWNWFMGLSYRQSEPHITQRRGQDGNLWWHGYNPSTGETTCLGSENEVRIWLDQPSNYHSGLPYKPWWS